MINGDGPVRPDRGMAKPTPRYHQEEPADQPQAGSDRGAQADPSDRRFALGTTRLPGRDDVVPLEAGTRRRDRRGEPRRSVRTIPSRLRSRDRCQLADGAYRPQAMPGIAAIARKSRPDRPDRQAPQASPGATCPERQDLDDGTG